MGIKLQPIPPVDTVAALAGPVLEKLQELDVITGDLNSWTYLKPLLDMRNRGEIRLDVACYVVRYILEQTGVHDLSLPYATLAAMDSLGRVDTSTLTPECLKSIVEHVRSLHYEVIAGLIKTVGQLSLRITARMESARARCPSGVVWVYFIRKAGDHLRSMLPDL